MSRACIWQVASGCYVADSNTDPNNKHMTNMKLINRNRAGGQPLCLTAFALLAGGMMAQAQIFTPANNDLILGFRKNAPYTENNEVVVDIGQASTYFNLGVGTTITVPGFSASQLSPGSFSTLNNLSWSVFAAYGGGYSGYPNFTLWLTVPRANNAVRSASPTRQTSGVHQLTKTRMTSIVAGADYISSNSASNQFNTPSFVSESLAAYTGHNLSTWLAGAIDPTQATFNDNWPSSEPNRGNIEITTPGSFNSGTVRSDVYEVRPLTTVVGTPITDPHTGTSGLAWYIGYFEFTSNGTMTFTRDAATTTPAPVALNIARTNNANTISFGSSSSVTYTLAFTNSAGLGTPVSNWPSLPGTITGDGTTKFFQDTTTDPMRFYRVREQ
jgi:hypothetical protein